MLICVHFYFRKNKTNRPISSVCHILATTDKAIHCKQLGGGGEGWHIMKRCTRRSFRKKYSSSVSISSRALFGYKLIFLTFYRKLQNDDFIKKYSSYTISPRYLDHKISIPYCGLYKRKRNRSDWVLWQKPLHRQNNPNKRPKGPHIVHLSTMCHFLTD